MAEPLDMLALEHIDSLRAYLISLYSGVFSDEAIEAHIRDYIGLTFAKYACSVLAQHVPLGASVLDIGSGFGAFVLLARESGYDARGIEPSAFEVDFARTRLARLRPQDDVGYVFRKGKAEDLGGCAHFFGAITLWNVVEHISSTKQLLKICYDLLLPGGKLFIISPNYCAWRDEAHYLIPWTPLDLKYRERFARRLSAIGKNPAYFRESIVPVTNWGVLTTLIRCGFMLYDFSGRRMWPWPIFSTYQARQGLYFWNPFVASLLVLAVKMESV